MTRPLLLDAYCGAGGAAKGYSDAGFDIVGVDLNPQPRYPFTFVQGDAIEFIRDHHHEFDAIHTSPPCQYYSMMSRCQPDLAAQYPDLIDPTRAVLQTTGLPWVIENVVCAPLIRPIRLCGFSFGRDLYRHRLFEANFPIQPKRHLEHTKPGSRAGHWKPGEIISISGNFSPVWLAKEVMEIDWMLRRELAEALPPYYTEYIGEYLMREVLRRAEAA